MIGRFVAVLVTGATIWPTAVTSTMAKNVVNIYTTPKAYKEATGKEIATFSEAPMLAVKVAIGELPPVEKRLPEEPLILGPAEEIGQYGGVLRLVWGGPKDIGYVREDTFEQPLNYSSSMLAPDAKDVVKPNIFKSWTVNEDASTFTFHIRKGIKWSDGQPFTADDFVFWYEDVASNKELNPIGVADFKIGGEMGRIKKIDDYAISYSFSKPYSIFIEKLCRIRPVPAYAPKHYLKQFHPKYASRIELQKKAKAAGLDTWVSLFQAKLDKESNLETPTICAWKVANRTGEPILRLVRNPYYWKVDTEGNQLPYIDEVDYVFVVNREARLIKVLTGDVDRIEDTQVGGAIENVGVLKEYEKRGHYKLVFKKGSNNGMGTIYFNYSHEDPVLRKIFLDKRFRIALSVGINREELNDLLFYGQNVIRNASPPDGSPYHGELPQFSVYTQYDPQLANQLLDAMGLEWDKDHEFRLRPDGKPLNIVGTSLEGRVYMRILEMYKRYWKDIGVNITAKPVASSLFWTRVQANKTELWVTALNMGGRRPTFAAAESSVIPDGPSFSVNPAWGMWCGSEGKKGDEPPEDVKRLYQLSKEFLSEPDEAKRIAIEKELYVIYCENLWNLSGVYSTGDKRFSVISNRLKNVPSPMSIDAVYDQPSQWFIKGK